MIVHWPARIQSKNELRHEPSHLIDLMPTCLDAAGAAYPAEYNGHRIKPMEGKSLLPVFDGMSLERRAIYWEHEGNRAVRVGRWKLVAKGAAGRDNVKWELYDIDADRGELHDLAEKDPDRVAEMSRSWRTYAERANVIPWPNNR